MDGWIFGVYAKRFEPMMEAYASYGRIVDIMGKMYENLPPLNAFNSAMCPSY